MKYTFTMPLQQNANGRIIPIEVMQKAIEDYMQRDDKILYFGGRACLPQQLSNACGVIKDVHMYKSHASFDVDIIDNDRGKVLQALLSNNFGPKLAVQGIVDNKEQIDKFDITAVVIDSDLQ